MDRFFNSISVAAESPYAFAAYSICAIIFVVAGIRLQRTIALSRQIKNIPASERRRALEIAADTVLPTSITAEEWIRNNKLKWGYSLASSVLIAACSVSVIAILSPTNFDKADINDINNNIENSKQDIISDIKTSREEIINRNDSNTIAHLETLFPLIARIEREVDGTIVELDGSPLQPITSYDRDRTPMKVHWGDSFYYMVVRADGDSKPDSPIFLHAVSSKRTEKLPISTSPYDEHTIRVPGSTPEPMKAYIYNPGGRRGLSLKITIKSADRERARATFRDALMASSLSKVAARAYQSVGTEGTKLTITPGGEVLRDLEGGTYLRVLEGVRGWSKVRLPEGREGWVLSSALEPIDSHGH